MTALILVALVAARWPLPMSLDYDDYGQYLSHARALLEGRPYGDIGYLFTGDQPFIGPPLEPPGLPLTLIPLLALGVTTSVMTGVLMLLGLALFLILAGRSLHRIEPVPAAAAVLLTGTALILSGAPAALGSDLIFAALLWALILVADRPGPWTAGRMAWFTFLGTWAFLYRLAAVAVLPALVVYWLVNRKRTKQWVVIPLVVFTVLFIWQYILVGIGRLPVEPARLADDGPSPILQGIHNLVAYRIAVFQSHLYPTPVNSLNDVYHLGSTVLGIGGVALWVVRARRSLAPLLAGSYGAMLLATGIITMRYAWPLYPISAFGLWLGWRWIWLSRSQDPRKADRSVILGAITVSVLAVWSHGSLAGEPPPTVDDPPVQALYQEVRHLGEVNPTIRLGYFKPRSLTWLTGVPAMPLFIASEPITFAELGSQRITHIAIGSLGLNPSLTVHWRQLAREHPDIFRQIWSTDGFTVWEIDSVALSKAQVPQAGSMEP